MPGRSGEGRGEETPPPPVLVTAGRTRHGVRAARRLEEGERSQRSPRVQVESAPGGGGARQRGGEGRGWRRRSQMSGSGAWGGGAWSTGEQRSPPSHLPPQPERGAFLRRPGRVRLARPLSSGKVDLGEGGGNRCLRRSRSAWGRRRHLGARLPARGARSARARNPGQGKIPGRPRWKCGGRGEGRAEKLRRHPSLAGPAWRLQREAPFTPSGGLEQSHGQQHRWCPPPPHGLSPLDA